MKRARCLVALLAVAFGAAHAEEVDRLEAWLGAEEYRAMGLEKLAPAERLRLQRWLLRHFEGRPAPLPAPAVSFSMTPAAAADDGEAVPPSTPVGVSFVVNPAPPTAAPAAAPPAAPAAQATPEDASAFGLEQTGTGPKEFHARIVGAFTGWSGKTEFVLDNGQVWRQSSSGVYRHEATDPEVVIERSFIGYKLRLVSTKRSISVRRVK